MRHLRTALFIVIIFGVVSGYFVWKTFFAIPPRLYPQIFNKAVWISSPSQQPVAYFRKVLFIPEKIKEGWIKISAPDKFILYINGRVVGKETFPSVNAAGIYDIGGSLQHGKNVIAVFVYRMSSGSATDIAMEGNYTDVSGHQHAFSSDKSWRVSNQESYASSGTNISAWYEQDFDDTNWKYASEISPAQGYDNGFLTTNPAVFTRPFRGNIIWHPDAPSSTILFKKDIIISREPLREVWVRIYSGLSYTLTVNGFRLDGVAFITPMVDMLKITPLIHNGNNVITLEVSGEGNTQGIAVDCIVEMADGKIISLASDRSWMAGSYAYISGEGKRDIIWKPAITVVSGTASISTAQIQKRILGPINLPQGYYTYRFMRMTAVIFLNTVLLILAWLVLSVIRKKVLIIDTSLIEHLQITSYLFLPSLLFFGIIYLLSFDIKYEPSVIFNPWAFYVSGGIFVFLFLLSFLRLKHYALKDSTGFSSYSEILQKKYAVFLILLIILCLTGFLIRLQSLGSRSFSHDEVAMVRFAQGILEHGYSSKMLGELEKPLTTYEAVPFPIAFSIKMFGDTETAARVPAVIFGTVTILLVGLFAGRLFGYAVGLYAAILYTFSPLAIAWAQDCYFPQQVQMFTLLTVYLFYIYLERYDKQPRYAYYIAISFLLTYLSWEVSGFLLPALLIAGILYKGKDLSWLKNRHIWLAVGIVVAGVFLQTARRTYYQIPYIVVGIGTSDVTTPLPVFLYPMYDPFFYVTNFLLQENHVIFTLLLVCGIIFLRKYKGLRYLYAIIIIILLELANLLPYYTSRYIYFSQPFLIIIAACVSILSFSWMAEKIKGLRLPILSPVIWGTCSVFLVVVFISSNSLFLKLYRLSYDPTQPAFHTRSGVIDYDYRDVGAFIKSNLQKGDIVIAVMSHTIEYYSDITPDYYIQSYTDRQVFYDIGRSGNPSPYYLDRYVGRPVIRSVSDLKNVFNNNRRVWIAAVNYRTFVAFDDKEMLDYIQLNSKPVYRGYNAAVYLWER
ncbi:MAG: glycosyltransferase family 39 protein [Nitrospirae bacterium]|nr:glycosyltransferase family 39 protein [Nitrospirota bacterium]